MPAAPAPEAPVLRIEWDGRLHSRLLARVGQTELALGDFRPSELVVVQGRVVDDFTAQGATERRIADELGQGLRIDRRGVGARLRKDLSAIYYDDFPGLAVLQTTYTVTGLAPVRIERWIERRFLAAGDGPDRRFWSFQSGSYDKRPDWVLPVVPGFTQRNYLGMNATDYGGGTPVVDLWRRDLGVAVGHLETSPRQVSLPVSMPDRRGVQLGIEERVDRLLQPGQSLTTPRTFVSLHRGDHFVTLDRYRRLMDRRGLHLPAAPASAYDPIWCGWGYGRGVTVDQMVGTLGKAAELGFKWAVLDDGWQTAEGDWALHPRKFPGGEGDMRALTAAMRVAGLQPMLWWAPLAADPGSELLRQHPDFLLLGPDGKPRKISWWDAYYLCPAHPPVRRWTAGLVTRFVRDWGFLGLKLDGQHLNAAPPCYNPAHRHPHPSDSFARLPELFATIADTARALEPRALIELCPCGTSYAFHSLPYMHLSVASDPESSWQIRLKGKTLKALAPAAAYFGDHVELSDGGVDFASTVGVGGVVGTQFTLPGLGRSERKYQLTPKKEALWRRWVALYTARMLSRGEYRGELYDLGFDRPEAHAIFKDGKMHYAFFAAAFRGAIELRGLAPGPHCLRDYLNDRAVGEVVGPVARLPVRFRRHLLLEAIPRPAGQGPCAP